jgi:hypothetical protein
MDCGQAGQFQKRVMVRRLGRARSWVFEISTTDPIPWRIVDMYLDAPGADFKTKTQRLAKDIAKVT